MSIGEIGLIILFYYFTFLNFIFLVICEVIIKYTVYLLLNLVFNRVEIKLN